MASIALQAACRTGGAPRARKLRELRIAALLAASCDEGVMPVGASKIVGVLVVVLVFLWLLGGL